MVTTPVGVAYTFRMLADMSIGPSGADRTVLTASAR
jgi:hypothetical protein